MIERFLFILLLVFLTSSLTAQVPVPVAEEPEAPEALFDQKIGDVGVILEADGRWTTRLAGGWGQGFSPLGTLPGLGYPGFERGGVFSQQPDFSLTLRLMERYYLEVVYSGTLEDRSFLVGYDGAQEPLRWVKVGNTPFTVPARADQTMAMGRRGAPAAGAAVVLGPVEGEVLARYEDGSRETRTFRGYRDTSSALVPVDQYIRGRFFQIPPSQAPFAGVRLLVADPSGALGSDGVRYREAGLSDAVVNQASGAIQLPTAATRRFLIAWTGISGWVASPNSLLGLTPEVVSFGGQSWVVLIQPGTAGVLEERNRYPVVQGTTGAITLEDRLSGVPVAGVTVGQSSTQDWFEVSGPGEAPFLSSLPEIYPHGSGAGGTPPPNPVTLPWIFRLPGPPPSTSFSLGPEILPSSLVVVRNGVPTGAYEFDPGPGTLKLTTPVFDTDTVEISFQRSKTAAKASDLVLWQGGRWNLFPDQSVEWALQGRWNTEQGRFTTEDLQSPGKVAASVSYQGSAADWSWKLSASGGAVLADSTGRRRLYGWATDGVQAVLGGDSLRPSALPRLAGLALTETQRAELVYRNYWSNDPLTGAPQVALWGKAGVNPEPSVAGGWIGPYLVRGDGVRTDRLTVLEARMDPGQWAALQVFLDQGKPRDLKSASAVTVSLRLPAGLGPGDRVFFQAGTLAEDWDGTGTVRSIEYRTVPALAFQDANRGSRYFPIPEGSTWGNDAEADGSAGTDALLVERELNLSPTTGDWQNVRLLLSDTERAVLQRTTGWRLVVVQGTGSTTQTVLVGPVVFEGAGWTVVPDKTATGSVHPVQQVNPGDKDLQQLRIDWQGRPQWTVEGRHAPLRPATYKTLVFRYRLEAEATASTTIKLSLTDGDGRGVHAEWAASPTPGWVQGRIDLREKRLTIAGVEIGTVSLVPGATAWDRVFLTKGGDSTSGTLTWAELEALDPRWEPLGVSAASAQWKQPEPWPSRSWPLLSGLTWLGTTSQSGLTSDDWSWKAQTSLAGTVGFLRASGEADAQGTPGAQEVHGAYEATLPLGWEGGPRLEWTDKFSDRGLRAEKLVLVLPWAGTGELQAQAKGPPTALEQEYRAGWTLEPQPGWGASVNTQWNQSRPQKRPLEGFAQTWQNSWGWLAPPPETAPFYLLQGQGEAKAAWGGWSVLLKDQTQVSQSQGTDLKWTSWGGWEARLPYRADTREAWSVTPSVSKSAEAVYSGLASLAPLESARQALDWLWMTPGALASAPFVEQDSALVPWKDHSGLQLAKVQSALGLDWERSAQSDWTDLVVPAGAGLKLTTTRGQEGLAGYRAATVKASVQAKALNLFGSLGSLPLFPWYRTDVLSWSATGNWGGGSRPADQNADTTLALRTEVILTTEESLALPLSYQGRWGTSPSHSMRAQPTWSLRRPADLPFELPRWLSPSQFARQWVQEWGASVDLGWRPTPSPVVRDLQIQWKGRLLLSEKSEFNLTTRWGQQWQENLTVVGLEAAIELVLNF